MKTAAEIPTISVVMPVYNAAAYVRAAVESILAQSYIDFDLIVINDGSTDDSLEIIQGLARRDVRIRIISRPNTGIAGVLNDGVSAARGEFIARMDADDIALPHRFESQSAFLRSHPDCAAVGSAVLLIDSDGDPICVQHWAETHEEIDSLLLKGWGGLAHPAAMIRAAPLRQIGGYRREYEWIEDKDLWLRLAEIGRLVNLREPLIKYRVHETSVTFHREAEQWRLWEQLLAETYERRGLTATPPKFASRRRKATGAGHIRAGWIRAAARNGNLYTAAKHAKILFKERPLRPSTWVTLMRAALALSKHRLHAFQQPAG